VGTVRGRGRKPEGDCITSNFTEGNVMLRRGIFRKLKAIIIDKYSELCEMANAFLNGFDPSFIEIFNDFINIKAIYLNKEQKRNRATRKSSVDDESEDENTVRDVIRRVSYKYSKSAMEEFFREPKLNNLFIYFAEEIIARGHQKSENRKGKNKGAAVPDE
jgi:hypothetical protein